MRSYRLIIVIIILVSCKATVPTTTGSYSEDLSVHRPESMTEVTASTDQDRDEMINEHYIPLEGHIKNELDSIAKVAYLQNRQGRYVDGFVIQVYSGNSREEANTSRSKMATFFPELEPKISYHQPSFRVKGGKFTDRLQANRVYKEVKDEFPRALLIPERFLLTYE